MICGSMLRVNPALRVVAQGWLHRCRRGARAGGGAGARRIEVAHSQYYGWALKNRAALRRSGRRSPKYCTVSSRNRPLTGARIETRARPLARLSEALDRHRGNGQQQITVKHVTVNADQAVVGCHSSLVAGLPDKCEGSFAVMRS